MTRKEEIKQAANAYIGHPYEIEEDVDVSMSRNAFMEGARWADNHPAIKVGGAAKNYQRGYEEAINKACGWLTELYKHYVIREFHTGNSFTEEQFIANFCKAMEE